VSRPTLADRLVLSSDRRVGYLAQCAINAMEGLELASFEAISTCLRKKFLSMTFWTSLLDVLESFSLQDDRRLQLAPTLLALYVCT
jgi:hypothetical protein